MIGKHDTPDSGVLKELVGQSQVEQVGVPPSAARQVADRQFDLTYARNRKLHDLQFVADRARRVRASSRTLTPMSEHDPPGWEGDEMNVSTRIAGEADLPFLSEVDGHVSEQDLTQVVAMGRVMVAEVDRATVGCLRWGLFWDAIPFMNLLFVVPERRGRGRHDAGSGMGEVASRRRRPSCSPHGVRRDVATSLPTARVRRYRRPAPSR